MYVCMHASMYVCVYACMHACMHVCMQVCRYRCVYAYIYIYIYIYACTYVSWGCPRREAPEKRWGTRGTRGRDKEPVLCSSVYVCMHVCMCIKRKVGKRVRSRRARRVYYTTRLEHETEIEGGGCA